jgi:hypothetical protein
VSQSGRCSSTHRRVRLHGQVEQHLQQEDQVDGCERPHIQVIAAQTDVQRLAGQHEEAAHDGQQQPGLAAVGPAREELSLGTTMALDTAARRVRVGRNSSLLQDGRENGARAGTDTVLGKRGWGSFKLKDPLRKDKIQPPWLARTHGTP